jgi:integrase
MTPQLTKVLAPLVNNQAMHQWLWLYRDGPISPVRFHYRIWQPVMRASNLAYRKPHSLRHTYASLLLTQGANMLYVKEQLGHHNIQVTVDIYGYLVPQSVRHADQLDTLP